MLDENGEPRPEGDVRAWGRWMRLHHERRVLARAAVEDEVVSTVFLGLDHSYHGGPPILWETMILEGPHRGYLLRYSTRYAALKGHQRVVDRLAAGAFDPYADDEGVEVMRLAKRAAAARWGSPG